MKIKGFIILSFLFLLVPLSLIHSQSAEPSGDKYTFLTMPFNKRQLNNYKGQLELSVGYKFAINSRSYDSNGDKTSLKDIGTASISHYYNLGIKYGVTNFLELEVQTNYMKSGTKSQSLSYYSSNSTGGVDMVNVYTLDETKGFSDLFLSGALRLPFEYKWFDFRVSGAYFLPTSKFKPPEPTNTITDVTSANSYTINYHYNNKNGFGVPVIQFTGEAKVNLSKFTLMASYIFQDPVKEGQNIKWTQILLNQKFTYYSQPYQYLLNRTTSFDLSFHYQAAGWFNVNLNMNFLHSSKGWTEFWGSKYMNPDQKLFSLEPGFEIQVSPLVRIYEVIGLPVSGKNAYGPFFLYTTFHFNLFPFRKF
jgi:hypothetical protein